MKVRNWLIYKLGGVSWEDYKTVCNIRQDLIKKIHEDYPKWQYPEQEEQQNNGMSRESSTTTTIPGVQRLAYTSKLGVEIPAYSLRTDKSTSNTTQSINKNVGKDKKKVRPVKQSRKHK